MPMPHRTFQQVIKRRLVGKDGAARTRELRAILAELPDYKNGPYADLRKWVNEQLAETKQRTSVVHRDSIAVRREGAAQIALVGPPNAGKSSLLQALSSVQIKTGDYAFTTTRPVPAVIRAGGVPVQLVEIPGLIAGAVADRGGGRALLGVLRGADAIVLCHDASASIADFDAIRSELRDATIEKPTIVAATKVDDVTNDELTAALERLRDRVPDVQVIPISVLDAESLDALRHAIWSLTGLVRIHLRKGDDIAEDPLALAPPVTVIDVADAIHHDLARRCEGARLWSASAKFPGQVVGPRHVLGDGDTVEIITAR